MGWSVGQAIGRLSLPPRPVAALFVEAGGVYSRAWGVRCYDGTPGFDARDYEGNAPVVAHPPCARWSRLAALVASQTPSFRRHEDGGCVTAAFTAVIRCGGVLEHPAYTDAWGYLALPRPDRHGGWTREVWNTLGIPCLGWVCHVEQGHYGHRARKPTWLYVYGYEDAPPPLIWGPSAATGKVGRGMERVERSRTPVAFRDALLRLARGSHVGARMRRVAK